MWFFNAMAVLICFLFVYLLGLISGIWAEKHTIIRRLKSQGVDPEFIKKIEEMD